MPKGEPQGQRVTWNDTMDKALLLMIIKLGTTTLPKMEDVAAGMGGGLTASAAANRYSKLQKQAKDAEFGGDAASTPKSTPKPKNAAKSGASAKKRKASKAVSEEPTGLGASEDDDEEKTPLVKKVKREVAEEDDYDERL